MLSREVFQEMADREQAILDRLKTVTMSKGISQDYTGLWFADEVNRIKQRLSLYKMLAEETPDERVARERAWENR